MTEEQYAKQLDVILFALSDEHPEGAGPMGNKSSISEITVEREDRGYPKRIANVRSWDIDLLCHILQVNSILMKGYLLVLEENDYIEVVSSKGGGTAEIKPRGLVFLNSGGFTRELKDKKDKQKKTVYSMNAAVASAFVAGALLIVTAFQAWLAYKANSEKEVGDNSIQAIEERMLFLQKKVDSLSVLINTTPIYKPDSSIIISNYRENKSK